MLRVCGVTYDHTINYGSCLQAYALQKAVESFLIDGEPCQYELLPVCIFPDYRAAVLHADSILKKLKMFPIHKIIIPIERRSFRIFEDRHMVFTGCSEGGELAKLNREYDAFVCGSDVIWNPDYNFRKPYFYLDFASKYSFSYAASFGKTSVSEEELSRVRPWIEKLDAIGVRDGRSALYVSNITNREVIKVADPVVLLTRKEWDIVADEGLQNNRKEKYIFVYLTDYFYEAKGFVKMLQKQTGLKVIAATADHTAAIKFQHFHTQSPQRWLDQLRNAEYVITNSFHASVFSVIFQKKFFTVVHGPMDSGINIRMHEFLNNMGLESRLFNSVPEAIDEGDFDFTTANVELEQMRAFSLKFLHDNLEAAHKEKRKLERHDYLVEGVTSRGKE